MEYKWDNMMQMGNEIQIDNMIKWNITGIMGSNGVMKYKCGDEIQMELCY